MKRSFIWKGPLTSNRAPEKYHEECPANRSSAHTVMVVAVVVSASAQLPGEARVRAREIGIKPGVLAPGSLNAITDVPGVKVGQVTLRSGPNIRTGVTAIIPHAGNVFQQKVPAAVYVGNGFGKLIGTLHR